MAGIGKPEEMESPSHIRETIEVGGAERIGHGLDVLYERDPQGLLAMMKRKHILVEDPIVIHEILGIGPCRRRAAGVSQSRRAGRARNRR